MIISTFHSDSNKPLIMAILNVTPDSFYDGGLLFNNNNVSLDLVIKKVEDRQETPNEAKNDQRDSFEIYKYNQVKDIEEEYQKVMKSLN